MFIYVQTKIVQNDKFVKKKMYIIMTNMVTYFVHFDGARLDTCHHSARFLCAQKLT